MSLGGKNIKCKINAKGAKIKPKRVHGVSSSSGEGWGYGFWTVILTSAVKNLN